MTHVCQRLVRTTQKKKNHGKPALVVCSNGLLFVSFNDAVSITDYIALYERIVCELKMTAKSLINILCQSSPTAGLAILWHACSKLHVERFPWHAEFTAVPIFFISLARPLSLCCAEHVYIYTHICPRTDGILITGTVWAIAVTGLRTGRYRVRIPAGTRDFSLL
jgi:hypothetical protein